MSLALYVTMEDALGMRLVDCGLFSVWRNLRVCNGYCRDNQRACGWAREGEREREREICIN